MGYEALRFVIERVSGEAYEAYLGKSFFKPLHLASTEATVGPRKVRDQALGGQTVNGVLSPTATVGEAASSVGVSVGGIYSTTGDLYRWVDALREGRVLPQRIFRDMVRPHSPNAVGPYDQYGYGWLVVKSGSAFWHTGGISMAFSSVLFVDERQDVVVVALSNDYATAEEFFARLFDFERDARDGVRGFAWKLPLGAAIAVLASLALVFRLGRQLRRRNRVLALPMLRRFLVLVLVPAGIAYVAWREYVPKLTSVGSTRIAFTIAPLWPRLLIALAALYVLLAAIAAHAVTRKCGRTNGNGAA